MDVITLAVAKKFTKDSLKGAGALKGANCTIKSIEAVPEGNKVTFEWTLTDGSKKTDFIIIKDGVDGKDGKDGIDGIDGEKGDKGDQGDKGVGIESITKKSSAGLVDTYQIVFTDGTESSFDVVNGANITKTSQLENDSNFITNVVNNLLNYYTKDEVYTKANIDELLRKVGAGLSVKIVTVLPTEEISGTTIYLIKTSGNNYNQYMWIDNAWANLGSTTVDLSNYYTKGKVDEILLGYVTKDVLASVLIDYVKKSELARVATSNDYNDLDNLPQIPDVSGIKPYTNVLQDSDGTAPTSKALYDAVSGINSEVEKKAKSSDVGNISELSTTDKSSVVAAINGVNDSLDSKADKNAVLNSLEIKNGYTAAQIIPWSDGTHYRSFEDKSNNTYTDIVTNNGIALLARTENGKQTKSEELATMDKVVKASETTIETLYNNSTGAFLETDMNLTATRSGILKVSFSKKETGNTINIYINDIHKYAYPNWWGENVYETAYVPVNNGDNIRISSDVSEGGDRYRIVNVLII